MLPASAKRQEASAVMARLATALALLLVATTTAGAQPAPPVDLARLEANAARRWPQPVLVSDLAGIPVLDGRLGRLGVTDRVVGSSEGAPRVVIRYGGWLGFGARPIALPLAGIAMLGRQVVVMDISREQLDAWPTFADKDGVALPGSDVVKVGLTKN
jgi:hypothetical protein